MNTLLFVLKSHFPHVLLSCKSTMCLTDCDFKELLLGTKYFIINNIIIIWVGKGQHACYSVCMEARGQLCGTGSLLPFVDPRCSTSTRWTISPAASALVFGAVLTLHTANPSIQETEAGGSLCQ